MFVRLVFSVYSTVTRLCIIKIRILHQCYIFFRYDILVFI